MNNHDTGNESSWEKKNVFLEKKKKKRRHEWQTQKKLTLEHNDKNSSGPRVTHDRRSSPFYVRQAFSLLHQAK